MYLDQYGMVQFGNGGGGGGGAVSSVNGKTGVVVLNAADVQAIPVNGEIPSSSTLDVTQVVSGATKHYLRGDYNGYFYVGQGFATMVDSLRANGAIVNFGTPITSTTITGEQLIGLYNNDIRTIIPTAGCTIKLSVPTNAYISTRELWIAMPDPAVNFTIAPSTGLGALMWADSYGNFSTTNPVPDFSVGNRLYAIAARYDGTNWLLNIAYTKDL